ncbi:hypothetical protein MBT84_34590 [Streptomyces sp. MBT84]|nr:hypothetical protein [Streptomyces sp. MBT84]REE59525.1 hypothetical protein BX257_2037 [Streptomyces sp. 3212.3]
MFFEKNCPWIKKIEVRRTRRMGRGQKCVTLFRNAEVFLRKYDKRRVLLGFKCRRTSGM